ncbi:hypothetical protein LYNGBM3L_68230 [Moorena producens 3L]|uniref:Uncharacterized protein n=1 Tax=Moorena producens 3L TaxID=489825 RepID=F4Y2Q5_9CYAN|nr:hypothetical protein [Moorena producens 3L]EGJ28899.1 hypothetical protein LYNGBM3L_68230 [Moorena producens 3L]
MGISYIFAGVFNDHWQLFRNHIQRFAIQLGTKFWVFREQGASEQGAGKRE